MVSDLIAAGLSQEEIASKIGRDQTTVHHYLHGRNCKRISLEVATSLRKLHQRTMRNVRTKSPTANDTAAAA